MTMKKIPVKNCLKCVNYDACEDFDDGTQQKFLSVHHGPSSMRAAQDTELNEIVVALKEFLVDQVT